MKQLFTLLTFSLLCFGTISAQSVGDEFVENGIKYEITKIDPMEVAVRRNRDNKYSGDFTIPQTVTSNGNTYTVTAINYFAFDSCDELTSVTIPSSITTIGGNAFYYCSSLTSITIPSSVTLIEKGAFMFCSGLETISVDAKNTKYYSSGNCIVDKETNELILGCKNSVIPSSVVSIYCKAFLGYNLSEIINIEEGNIKFYTSGNCIIEKETNTLVLGCKNSVIPDGVEIIGNSAFQGCSELTAINIPESVTDIEGAAFCGCSGLTSITLPKGIKTIGEVAFLDSGIEKIFLLSNTPPKIGEYNSCFNKVAVMIPEGSYDNYYAELGSHATLVEGYVVSGSVQNAAMGSVSVSKPIVNANETITLTAVANEGYYYTKWGDGTTDNPRSVTVISDTTFIAEFAANTYNITASEVENGSVTIDGEKEHGSTITLTATAIEGYHFTKWSDGNTDNPRSVTVTSDATFTAVFEKDTEQGGEENQEGNENTNSGETDNGNSGNNNVAIGENEAAKLLVYPSPATSVVTVGGVEPNTLVKVYNTNGAMVIATTLEGNSLNVSNLTKGVYIVETENGKVARFVKQ